MGIVHFLLAELWPYLVGMAVVVMGWFVGKQQGRIAEQSKQAQKDLKGVQNAIKARNEIDALDDDAVRDRARERMRYRTK